MAMPRIFFTWLVTIRIAALEAISPPVAAPAANRDDEQTPDLASLSRILYLSAGITKRKRHPGGETRFRAYANTGALHHIDLYVVAGRQCGRRRYQEGDCCGAKTLVFAGAPLNFIHR